MVIVGSMDFWGPGRGFSALPWATAVVVEIFFPEKKASIGVSKLLGEVPGREDFRVERINSVMGANGLRVVVQRSARNHPGWNRLYG